MNIRTGLQTPSSYGVEFTRTEKDHCQMRKYVKPNKEQHLVKKKSSSSQRLRYKPGNIIQLSAKKMFLLQSLKLTTCNYVFWLQKWQIITKGKI